MDAVTSVSSINVRQLIKRVKRHQLFTDSGQRNLLRGLMVYSRCNHDDVSVSICRSASQTLEYITTRFTRRPRVIYAEAGSAAGTFVWWPLVTARPPPAGLQQNPVGSPPSGRPAGAAAAASFGGRRSQPEETAR